MIGIKEQVQIDAPIDVVWSYLREPEGIVQCIPGAALSEARADGTYLGTMTVAFGPTRVKFQGEVALEYGPEPYLCRAKSRGRDQRGMSNATGEGVFSLEDAGQVTTLHVTGTFALTGPLAPFAKSGGPVVVRTLLGEFSRQLSALASADSSTEAAPDQVGQSAITEAVPALQPASQVQPSPPARAESMSAGRLILGVIKEWLRGLFGGRRN